MSEITADCIKATLREQGNVLSHYVVAQCIDDLQAQLAQARDRMLCETVDARDKYIEQLQQQLAQCPQERGHFEYKYHELAKAAGDDIDTLKQDLARLRDKVERANAALGEHPDTEIGLAARISELRDEGRAYFHENTRLRQELERLRQEMQGCDG